LKQDKNEIEKPQKSILGIINSANDWVPPETKEMLERQSARQIQIENGEKNRLKAETKYFE
jgi:hypothetical protein